MFDFMLALLFSFGAVIGMRVLMTTNALRTWLYPRAALLKSLEEQLLSNPSAPPSTVTIYGELLRYRRWMETFLYSLINVTA